MSSALIDTANMLYIFGQQDKGLCSEIDKFAHKHTIRIYHECRIRMYIFQFFKIVWKLFNKYAKFYRVNGK